MGIGEYQLHVSIVGKVGANRGHIFPLSGG